MKGSLGPPKSSLKSEEMSPQKFKNHYLAKKWEAHDIQPFNSLENAFEVAKWWKKHR